jgi:uncharacterized protein YjiS (DUF1127 family)
MVTITRNGPAVATRLPGGRSGTPAGLARRLAFGLLQALVAGQQRLADRETLAGMTEARLRDIGLTRAEANRAADKPFWRG